jgi:pimeloyl-ACP methyl ester carboxylesterase
MKSLLRDVDPDQIGTRPLDRQSQAAYQGQTNGTMKATIGGREVSWREAGSGEALVLIHGFPFDSRMWEPQLGNAPEGWRLIAPDLRGFGGSAAGPEDVYPMELFADDVAALLGHLGIRRAVVAGLSMGGYVTFALLRRHAALVRGIVLADTRAAADSEEARAARVQLAQRVRREGRGPVVDSMMPKLLSDETRRQRPEVGVRVKAMMEATPAETMARALLGMAARPSAEPQLRDIAVPTFVIVGSEDAITDRGEAQLLVRAIRGAQLEVLEGAGHVSSMEHPEAFNAALHRFLAVLPSPVV